MGKRFFERAYAPGDERTAAEIEVMCFPDAWPLSFFLTETSARGRYHRVVFEADSNTMAAYLLCAWQYLDLHILKIGVRPEYRREGLARLLMQGAHKEVYRLCGESIILEVRRANHAARQLYLSLGFDEVGKRQGYYSDGESAIVMRKFLEE